MTQQRLFPLPDLGAIIRNRLEQIFPLRPAPFSSVGVSFPPLYSGEWLLHVSKGKVSFPLEQTSLPPSAPSFHALAGIQTNDLALQNLLPLLRKSISSFSLSMLRNNKFYKQPCI